MLLAKHRVAIFDCGRYRTGLPSALRPQGSGEIAISLTINSFAQHRLEQLLFRFPDCRSWDAHLQGLQQLGYRATIVGPRGSGKSTLLRELHCRLSTSCDSAAECDKTVPGAKAISEPLAAMHFADGLHGLQTLLIDVPPLRCSAGDFGLTYHQRRQWLQTRLARVTPNTVLLVDGLERLPWPQRLWLTSWAGRPKRCAGLVATLHGPRIWARLPIWIRTLPTIELLEKLLTDLGRADTGTQLLADQLFKKYRGNLREVLREMYDRQTTGVGEP